MPITYPEGGMPGLLLKQMQRTRAIDTFKVQLVPLRAAPKAKISGPEDVVKLVREMEDYDRESSKIIHLDTKNQVMGVETISIGSLSMSIVHPRETVKGAILNNSANVIFVHNHPSGVCEPSNEDVEISGRLKEAFELVGIALLDSIIVGKGCRYSLRETGFITGQVKTPIKLTSESKRTPLKELPKEKRLELVRGIAGAPLEKGKYITYDEISKITAGQIQSSVIKEPLQDVADKVQFIGAMTEYITAPDLERRKRAAAKLQASKYFKNWFDKFFYVHDPQSAKENLMRFFGANERGLGAVNYAYYGVISEYLRAISKTIPELTVRENTAPLILHIKQEIKAIHALATKNDPSATRRAENTVKQIDSGVMARIITQEQARTLKEAVKNALYKIPYIEIARLIGEKEIVTAEPVVLKTEKLGTMYLSYVQLGKEVYSEWGKTPEEAVKNAIAKAEKQAKLGRAGAEVEIKYEPGKMFPFRVVYAGTDETVQTREYPEAMAYYTRTEAERGIAEEGHTLVGKGRPLHTVSENIQIINNIEAFLNRITVDTNRYSRAVPIPESAIIGAAIAVDGFLFAYHVTDYPEDVMHKLRSNIPLCQLNPEGDLGCGFYVSGVPEYWRVRSREKWEFARHLNRAQRQALVNVILSDPKYRKGGGYLADFEVDYLTRDLKQFIETGDVNLLAMTGNQPYNVRITEEIARKAGVPAPKIPKLVKIKLQGKFINAAGLYSNPDIVNRAQAWAVINMPKLLQYDKRASTQDIVNAWLCSMGYSGAFTKSGMTTNPEMVVWGRKAIIDAWIPEPQI